MKELEELGWQGAPGAGDMPDTTKQEQMLRQRVLELLEPLERKRKELETAKAMYQLGRDLEDETVSVLTVGGAGGTHECCRGLSGCSFLQLWVQERLSLARSTDHGTDLPSVQRLTKRNEVSLGTAATATIPSGPLGSIPWVTLTVASLVPADAAEGAGGPCPPPG